MAHKNPSPTSISSEFSNPSPRHPRFSVSREQQFRHLQNAIDATSPPPIDPSDNTEYVPTSIAMVGPGNYGRKEDDNGSEVVLLNDDVLTSVANATVVVIDGNDVERITVLYQFPQFLEHCPQEAINVMVPRICSEAVAWSADAQMAASEALYFVVGMKVPFRVANQVACAALQMTTNSDNIQVFDACGEIVSLILPQVHRYDVLRNIVPEAIDRAASDDAHHRRLAARIIGSLNDALSATELESIFIKTALNLTMDDDENVRALVAQSMASIGIKLPLLASETMLWPRLHQMMDDENAHVKAASLRAIAKSAEAHRESAQTSQLFDMLIRPLFLQECERAAEVAASDLRIVSDETYLILEIFSEVYGYFLCALASLLDKYELWNTVLTTLRLMVTCNGPTVRHWCSFNMPAISKVCSDGKMEHLSGILHALAGDTDLETRATLAAGIHEVTRNLRDGPLRNDVIRAVGMLFMDESPQVRMNSLGHFSTLLELLSFTDKAHLDDSKASLKVSEDVSIRLMPQRPSKDEVDEDEMRRLAPMFSSLELMSFDSWRTQRLLAEEVERAAHLIPQEMLCEHVAPLLFQMARESTFLVRKASMRSLVHVLRYVSDVRRRNHILRHFKMEWAHGKVYWTRLAFVEAGECARKVFSLKLFTTLFKEELLSLKDDEVVNVRIRLLRLLGDLAPVWKDLSDFREAVEQFAGDADSQLSQDAEALLDSLGDLSSRSEAEALLDRQKEEAEDAYFVYSSHKKRKSKTSKRQSGAAGDDLERGSSDDPNVKDSNLTVVREISANKLPRNHVIARQDSRQPSLPRPSPPHGINDSSGSGSGSGSKRGSGQMMPVSVSNSALADDSPVKGARPKSGSGSRRRVEPRNSKPILLTDDKAPTAATSGGVAVVGDEARAGGASKGGGGIFARICACFRGR